MGGLVPTRQNPIAIRVLRYQFKDTVASMNIAFIRKQLDSGYHIVTPQLPRWTCSGPTRSAANDAITASLREYVEQRPALSPAFRVEILKLADDWRDRDI